MKNNVDKCLVRIKQCHHVLQNILTSQIGEKNIKKLTFFALIVMKQVEMVFGQTINKIT